MIGPACFFAELSALEVFRVLLSFFGGPKAESDSTKRLGGLKGSAVLLPARFFAACCLWRVYISILVWGSYF